MDLHPRENISLWNLAYERNERSDPGNAYSALSSSGLAGALLGSQPALLPRMIYVMIHVLDDSEADYRGAHCAPKCSHHCKPEK